MTLRLSPEAVVSAFQNSGKKHLFLTGAKGSGKTTLLSRILPLLTGTSDLPGITTSAVPYRFAMLSDRTGGASAVIGRYDTQMRPVTDGFLVLGVPILENICRSGAAWAVLDELGFLESGCPAFQQAVRRLLSACRTITVLRKQDTPFLAELSGRDDVFLYDLDAPVLPVGCVVMASGRGRRFGGNKLLADFCGAPLLAPILSHTDGKLFARRIVVSAFPETAAVCRSLSADVLLHDLPHRNDTVRLGLSALLRQEAALSGCLFVPADQPLLRRESLEALVLAFSHLPDGIWRMSADGVPGAPILFGADFFAKLSALPEGRGGSFLAKKYPERVHTIPARDSFELFDVDTPQELLAYSALAASLGSSTFKRMATSAAGTMPEPPKIS